MKIQKKLVSEKGCWACASGKGLGGTKDSRRDGKGPMLGQKGQYERCGFMRRLCSEKRKRRGKGGDGKKKGSHGDFTATQREMLWSTQLQKGRDHAKDSLLFPVGGQGKKGSATKSRIYNATEKRGGSSSLFTCGSLRHKCGKGKTQTWNKGSTEWPPKRQLNWAANLIVCNEYWGKTGTLKSRQARTADWRAPIQH